MILRLDRTSTGPEGTFGTLTGLDFDYNTLELPWVDVDGNGLGDPQKSCITAGTYACAFGPSEHFAKIYPTLEPKGMCYHVNGVEGRSGILIHNANWSHQLLGCIALGKGRGVLNGKPAITQSRDAIKEFHNHMRQQPFELHISWV